MKCARTGSQLVEDIGRVRYSTTYLHQAWVYIVRGDHLVLMVKIIAPTIVVSKVLTT